MNHFCLSIGRARLNRIYLEEVGRKFKVTRERVRQLQNLALQKIRKLMAKNEAQRTVEEIEQDERLRKRMEVLREFFESKAAKKAGKN